MNKKLRLVVTAKCHNCCPMCCNNRFDLNELPVVDRWDYDEIMLTGGEPMLFPDRVINLIHTIRKAAACMGSNPKIYMYTALPEADAVATIGDGSGDLLSVLPLLDGVVVTPHDFIGVDEFVSINRALPANHGKSLRLNIFPEVSLPAGIDLSAWKVKEMQWVKDCPVPEGEDLRRINQLWV